MSAEPGQPPGQEIMAAPAQSPTALLDALIARGLASIAGTPVAASATPLEGYPQLPNPDPGSAPPLYGEPPGLGYLYAHDPHFRQGALVSTNPDMVREMLLRAIEVAASNSLLPFNNEGAAKQSEAALRFAQCYLLLDPTVDQAGVPIAGQATAKAGAQIAVEASKPQPSDGQAHGTVKAGKTVGGHTNPPRVLPGAAAQVLQEMHQNAETVLKGARGSRPLPRPRPSS